MYVESQHMYGDGEKNRETWKRCWITNWIKKKKILNVNSHMC